MKNNLDIFVPAAINSNFYMKVLRASMLNLADNPDNLRFKCIINTPDFNEVEGWQNLEIDLKTESFRHLMGGFSCNHAFQLNKIHKYIDSNYFVICDADVAVLQKGWDTTLMNLMENKKSNKIVGVHSSKLGKRHLNFPCVIFCMYEAESFLKLNLDFMPDFDYFPESKSYSFKKIKASQISEHLKNPDRDFFICDTGWKIPITYLKAGYTAEIIENEHNIGSKRLKKDFETWIYNGSPFIMHSRSSRVKNKHKLSIWNNLVTKFMPKDHKHFIKQYTKIYDKPYKKNYDTKRKGKYD